VHILRNSEEPAGWQMQAEPCWGAELRVGVRVLGITPHDQSLHLYPNPEPEQPLAQAQPVRIGPPTHFMRALKLQAGSGLNGDDAAGGPAAAAASPPSDDGSSGDEASDMDEAGDGGADPGAPPAGAGRGGGTGRGSGRGGGRGAGGRCPAPCLLLCALTFRVQGLAHLLPAASTVSATTTPAQRGFIADSLTAKLAVACHRGALLCVSRCCFSPAGGCPASCPDHSVHERMLRCPTP
jgi:hypothetical protein